MLHLYNTLTRKIEDFEPINPPKVGMYTCGPTVYDYTHIGHLRKYIGDDILHRLLEVNGFEVNHVMNITDVGHLTSDSDEGDDKLEKGAKDRNLTPEQTARFFEDYFFKSTEVVNIERPNIVARATEHINEQIKLLEKLQEKGFTYTTEHAVYFDISKFSDYGKLSGQKLEEKQVGVRENVVIDPNKKNPQDFALWFFTVGRFASHVMKWPSPFGEGFPGWHIECSAMSMEYLGETLDIHTGGIDHIPVHHTNEIAQSEAATEKQFSKYWVHHNFLIVDGEKMSKSKKNFYTIDDLVEKGFDPIAFRYLILTAHYRDSLNFTYESLTASSHALNNIISEIRAWDSPKLVNSQFWQKFLEAANNDMNTPQALAAMWELIKSDIPSSEKAATILEMDKILGLGLEKYVGKPLEIPEKVQELLNHRENARISGDFKKSDELRHEIKKLGFEIEDTATGSKLKPV
ncbi:MAG: cysteine--tRNA ligase [Candidatus Daviesbacteria bacterium]|nr:cysteine--tRNA ligase [Candidatus Daviesbacteria bacterium]